MFNPQDDEPLFYAKTQHPLLFACQCRRCVKMHTLTMGDAKFLHTCGIIWKVPHVQVDGSEQGNPREQDAREAGWAQEAQDIR